MHAKADISQEDIVPFGYLVVHEDGKPGWAIVSGPIGKQAAFIEAVNSGASQGVEVNLKSLIQAFNGKVTKSGWGSIPEEERRDLHRLYGGQEPAQGSLEL